MKTVGNQNKPNQAVLYVRVSSKGQEKEGFSIPAQLKLLYRMMNPLTGDSHLRLESPL